LIIVIPTEVTRLFLARGLCAPGHAVEEPLFDFRFSLDVPAKLASSILQTYSAFSTSGFGTRCSSILALSLSST
jgi:hypothetical protein